MDPVGAVLETVGLTKFFGMVRAAEDLSLRFQEGELVGIVGPNGSGKTTLLNVITGYVKPDRGRIRFQGKDITGLLPRAVADLGIARSFQMPQLYLSLSVLENLVLALAIRAGRAREFWAPLVRVDRLDDARRILVQFGLEEHASHDAGQLPEGARKLLDVALSFARRPRILLMDEPTSGVSARDKSKVMDTDEERLELVTLPVTLAAPINVSVTLPLTCWLNEKLPPTVIFQRVARRRARRPRGAAGASGATVAC